MESIIENDDRFEQSIVVPAENEQSSGEEEEEDVEFRHYTKGEENLDSSKDQEDYHSV